MNSFKEFLSCSGTGTCRKTKLISTVTAIKHSRNVKIVPIIPCSRSGPVSSFSFRHRYLYFEAALQTSSTLQNLFDCALDAVADTIHTQKCFSLWRRLVSLQNPSRLYLLTVDTKLSRSGPFGISVSKSEVDTMLSCKFSASFALANSTALPLLTARLLRFSKSLLSYMPAIPSVTDWLNWFWKQRLRCLTIDWYCQPLSNRFRRRNDKHFVFSCQSWVHWPPILILLKLRKNHLIYLSCSPIVSWPRMMPSSTMLKVLFGRTLKWLMLCFSSLQ